MGANLSLGLKSKLRTFTMVFALIAIWAIFAWQTEGSFLQARNISNLLRQMSVTGVLSVGMVLVIVAGQIDLSVGSVVCFLGAILAVLNTNKGYSPASAFAITLGVGVLIGVAQGFLASYQRIPAFIVTLGGMLGFRGASMWITENNTIPLQENWILSLGTSYLSPKLGWIVVATGLAFMIFRQVMNYRKLKDFKLQAPPLWSLALQITGISTLVVGFMAVLASYEGIPVPVLVMLGFMLLVHFAATQTTWGRHIYAIGGNRDAAFLSGINVKARILSIFALMGVLATVAGTILTARVGSASPDAGNLLELDAIASCVIGGTSLMGGKGSILGAILGALVMESLNNGMSMANIEPFWQFIVKGGVLVAAVWIDIASQGKTNKA
jgi:D-xylose transport system permease protein